MYVDISHHLHASSDTIILHDTNLAPSFPAPLIIVQQLRIHATTPSTRNVDNTDVEDGPSHPSPLVHSKHRLQRGWMSFNDSMMVAFWVAFASILVAYIPMHSKIMSALSKAWSYPRRESRADFHINVDGLPRRQFQIGMFK